MTYWPWWAGGLALCAVALVHWFAVGRLMGVSSRFTALVDHARGIGASASAEPLAGHFAFFGGVIGGGLVASLLTGTLAVSFAPGARFAHIFGDSPLLTAIVMGTGGVLVGAGTRMARGCTSGHGLCGVARFERGSLLATVAFFGTGVIVSMLIGALFA